MTTSGYKDLDAMWHPIYIGNPLNNESNGYPRCFQWRVCSRDTERERKSQRVLLLLSNQPLSGETYSGACTRPCSIPPSRNCCGCRHSLHIWSERTSSGSCQSASGAWRPGRGLSQPPGRTPLPGESLLLDHRATGGSALFQSQQQHTRKTLPPNTPHIRYIHEYD